MLHFEQAGQISAIGVDTLASAVVASDLARNNPDRKNISPDGTITVDATFGFLFSKSAAALPAISPLDPSGSETTLAECVQQLAQVAPDEFSMISYFEYYVDLSFRANTDVEDLRRAEEAAANSLQRSGIVWSALAGSSLSSSSSSSSSFLFVVAYDGCTRRALVLIFA